MKSNVYPPSQLTVNRAIVSSMEQYQNLYRESIDHPHDFWAKVARRLDWNRTWAEVSSYDFVKANISWFSGGKLNACVNCLDRHVLAGYGEETALIWEGNDPNESQTFTYSDLLSRVERLSNVLKKHGVRKGDRVSIYLQMIPELPIAMLASARIGAVHSVVFGAFSSESLSDRMNDSECKLLITQDFGVRGAKTDIPMKQNADRACESASSIKTVLVVERTGKTIPMTQGRDYFLASELSNASENCPAESMDAEDPLFILYTSGSTGKPKGVLHTTGGYLVYAAYTHELVFDYHPGDVYWCTADIGWVTGHSYIVYGPLANRATSLMFEGVPNYPDFGRFWAVVEKHRVNTFYTAPTALRALMKEGNRWPMQHDLSSLNILGTVGEPIKEPEWLWYHEMIGGKRCPIVDTWWQTETGGILITPLPGAIATKPGSATLPFFGVEPVILNEQGQELAGPAQGILAIKKPWPGIMRTVYGDHERFRQTYFDRFPGYYLTGDGARRDEDGYYWIIGRIDDVLNVSGHRIGTAEVEGAIGKAEGVAEAAVVGFPHDIKGQGIYAYVTVMTGKTTNEAMLSAIRQKVREIIGPHAVPDKIQFAESLPKTRSGKIMRRILRKIAEGDLENVGDTSTLADPGVVAKLIGERG